MASLAEGGDFGNDGENIVVDVGESEYAGEGAAGAEPAAAPPPPKPHPLGTQRALKDPKARDPAAAADPERQAIFSLPFKIQNMCKLCCVSPKVGKHPYDKVCRQKVEAAKRVICVDDESTEYFAELERMPDPTKLRIVVHDCEKEVNPDGQATRGNPRAGEFDIMSYREVWEASTIADEGQKRVPMHHFKFIKHFTEEEGMTPTEAQKHWEECEAGDCPRDWKGRNGALRLKVAVEDFELLFKRKRKGNELIGSLRDKKKPKAEDFDAVRDGMNARQPDFDDDFFGDLLGEGVNKVIGASTLQSRWTGQRDMPRGAGRQAARGSFGRAGAGGSGGGSGSAASAGDSEAPTPKKAKFDAESKRNQFRSACQDNAQQLKASMEETLESAEKTWGIFSPDDLAKDDYKQYHFTLVGRMAAMRVILGAGQKPALQKYFGPVTYVEGEDAVFDAALEEDAVSVQSFGDWLKDHGFAMPCVGFMAIPTMAALNLDAENAGAGVNSAEELKAAATLWKEKVQNIQELSLATKTAEKDLVARKTNLDKRQSQKAAQAAKQAAQERAKFERDEKKKAEKAAQEARKKASQPAAALTPRAAWTILTCDLKHHIEILKCAPADFKQSEVDWRRPHIVTNVDTAFFNDCKEAVAVTSAWKMGFPTSEPVKSKGKSTWGLPQSEALRSGLCQFGPPVEHCCDDLPSASYTNALRNVSVWGYSVSLRNSGTETHSLGSLRLQLTGRRLVIAARVEDVVGFVQEEAEPVIPKPTSTDLSNTFKYADQKVVDALRGRGARLFHTVVEPNSVLFMPVGFWVIEKPIGLEDNFGIRCSCLPRVPPASTVAESFRMLCEVLGNGMMDPKQFNYMSTVYQAMTGAPLDPQAAAEPAAAPLAPPEGPGPARDSGEGARTGAKEEEEGQAAAGEVKTEPAAGAGPEAKQEVAEVDRGADGDAKATMVPNKWGKYMGKKPVVPEGGAGATTAA